MKQNAFEALRQLPREELEAFAFKATSQLRSNRQEIEKGNLFVAVMIGFLLGALVASSGFLLGLGLA